MRLSGDLPPVLRPNLNTIWNKRGRRARVTARLQDLRPSYVTRLIEAGVSEAIARELVEHIDPVVLRRYTHIRRDAKKKAIEQALGVAPETAPEPVVKEFTRESPVEHLADNKGKRSKSLIM